MGPSEEGGSPASDELSPVQRERAIGAVLSYMVLKVSMDCSTISVWPLLLKNLYGGNVALAAAAAATTSSICGLGELLITPAVGKLSDRYGRRAFFLIGPLANVAVSLLQIRFQVSVSLSRCLSVSLSLCLSVSLYVFSLSLKIRFQGSVAVAYLQRVIGQTLSTISGTTICAYPAQLRLE